MNDLNKRRVEGVKAEQKYQAAWDAVFGVEENRDAESKRKGDDERCECGYHREACKFGTSGCPK